MDVHLSYRADLRPCDIRSTTGFTLVELMVVLVIVAMLASLTLAGLSGVRQRAKADKTRSTIRKIDSIIQPMYESYATRRVPSAGGDRLTRATSRLQNLRLLMTVEMPDLWDDVGYALPSGPGGFDWARNSVFRRYSQYKTPTAGSPPPSDDYQPAETLMMILSVGGFDSDCMASFRPDEIGDVDRDGFKEFLDGWGRPILFLRWPAAFALPLGASSQPDPLDVLRVTTDLALAPLVLSAGPDEGGYGIQYRQNPPWLSDLTASLPPVPFPQRWSTCLNNSNGSVASPQESSDNITNYDLITK